MQLGEGRSQEKFSLLVKGFFHRMEGKLIENFSLLLFFFFFFSQCDFFFPGFHAVIKWILLHTSLHIRFLIFSLFP